MSKASKNAKSNKKSKKDSAGTGADLLRQMGIEIPDFGIDGGDNDLDVDDDELLSELGLLEAGAGGSRPKRANPPPPPSQKKKSAAAPSLDVFHQDVNKLMKDIDAPLNDDELSGDEDELQAELDQMNAEFGDDDDQPTKEEPKPKAPSNNAIVSTLEARLIMYKQAAQIAKTKGEAAKSRRYERQLNVIQEFIRDARAGKPINESEIPPEIGNAAAAATLQQEASTPVAPATAAAPPPPRPPPPQQPVSVPKAEPPTKPKPSVVPTSNNVENEIARLTVLIKQAVNAGDMEKARQYLIQKKTLEGSNKAATVAAPPPPQQIPVNPVPDEEAAEPPAVPLVAPVPRTIMEALEQRRNEFAKRQKEAAAKGEGPKARRLDRVTKQYEEAIVATRKKQPFDYKELPDLPGFAPIPIDQGTSSQPAPTPVQVRPPVEPKVPPPEQPSSRPSTPVQKRPVANQRNEQQIEILRLRQKQFKDLALQSREKGDIETGKQHLISSKLVQQMLETAESGLPVNMDNLPELPLNDFDVVRDDELTQQIVQSDRDTIYRRLQEDLLRQMQLCARNQQIYAQMEGETNMKLSKDFKNLELRCSHDLERLKQSNQNGFKPPVFHYEKRQMNIIQVNNDLADNDCEVTVLRGINLHVPTGYTSAGLQTYVIYDFPFPPETPQSGRTRIATGSTNAEYDEQAHKFQLKRTDKKNQRLLERKELKLTIYYKGGFLRSDKQLGVAFVKLAPLLTTSIIHESVDVYENEHRRKPEGKLEVKIRIKEAIGEKKASQLISQVWLVIDHFDNASSNVKPSTQPSISTAPSISALSQLIPSTDALGLLAVSLARPSLSNDSNQLIDSRQPSTDSRRTSQQSAVAQSIQVLKFEAENLHKRIEELEEILSPDQIELFRSKHAELEEQRNQIIKNLREGGKQAMEEHIQNLNQLLERYKSEEEDYRQRNDTKKADLALNKKNLVAKEIEAFTEPIDTPISTSTF